MAVTITKELFGKTKEGKDVHSYTFTGAPVVVSVLDFGGAIQNIMAPDREGNMVDIALGYDDVAGYEKNEPYIGVLVGRVAGRIAKGKFTMDGKQYEMVINNKPNNIHGGTTGFSRRLWEASVKDNTLTLSYTSPDGEDGFPGEVKVSVSYTLSLDGALTLDYTATTTKPCPINLTHHAYFNLAGQNSATVFDHVAQIHAEKYVPVDKDLIPTGELPAVEGAGVVLRTPTVLQTRESNLRAGDLDVTYCLENNGKMKYVSRISHPASGRYVDTSTTVPGLQFYTSKYMNAVGKAGHSYKPFASFCLETQHYPDSVNHPHFPNTILRPGETYRQTTIFKFAAQ